MLKNILATALVATIGFSATQEVNIYSHRHYDTDKQLYKMFEKNTGIKVNIVKAKANELINRLESEGKNSPADILITSDAGRLYLAQEKGLLQTINSKILNEAVPENLRQKNGYWFALTKRARVIVYNKDKVNPSELSTYEDLTSPKFKGKVLIRKASNIYNQSLLASMIAHDGEKNAKAWAKGMVNNFARTPKGSDRDQMKAVAANVGDVAVVNTYYVGKLLNSKKTSEVKVGEKMGVFFPNQNDRGAHINISGAGVAKYSKNKENAVKLLEFLVSPKAQGMFAEANYEYPVNKNVKPSALLESWGTFKEDTLDLEELGKNNAKAVKIFNEVNWK
ncbi:Fe(3+) ABC transporter substrate-binding protein [Arcobacter sp. 15-2]|uniref:Fe(3+) ABC transporter substrate-binding protein n=1 Tax=Arcobacter sp. 15-2 TaxID=3374109 RepID=UPI00399CF2D1